MEEKKNECTLTNEELIQKVDAWVTKLSASGGSAWCLRVPVDFNEDPDMLIIELSKRFSIAVEKATKK